MSDFLQKFKSIFVVDDPNTAATKPTESTPPVEQKPVATSSQSTTYVPPPPMQTTGVMNEKFVEVLSKALEANNQPGFDFLEFRGSLQSLSKMPLDEATRFQSAFAMAQTMGATPQKLVDSANFYLGILKAEDDKFDEAVKQQRGKLIGNREQEMLNLQNTINNKAEQIKQLTKEIESHNQRIDQLKQEINEATVKVEATNADFEATYQSVVSQIQQDVAKIQLYLK